VDQPARLAGLGHPLKFIWEERAQSLTSYPNFWKQLYRKHSELRQATVTARDSAPGERVEVDYAGDPIEWVDVSTDEEKKPQPMILLVEREGVEPSTPAL